MHKAENDAQGFLQALPDVEQLKRDLEDHYSRADTAGFLCYDITSLRKVNHVYGRRAGDALLAAAARWVQGFSGAHLYRVDGDSFCLMFPNSSAAGIQHYAHVLDARFEGMWHLQDGDVQHNVYAQAAVAVLCALPRPNFDELPDLFERALEVSRRDRQIAIFSEAYDHMMLEHIRLQMELKTCVFSDMQGFSVHYQPVADPILGTWRGLEALCRWSGPTIGPVPPSLFIPEMEEMGLIHPLGYWVLDTALETCKALQLDRIDSFSLSVNTSAMQLTKPTYARTVLEILAKHRYPCEKLVLEITESTQFTFNETVLAAIDMLRRQGVKFALDDFGTGYSGFSNLKNLPADYLKTDQAFIDNIENDGYLQYFYFIMSETVHAGGMQLVAEGVETCEQLRSVVKNGADLVQGYLFGHAIDRFTLEKEIGHFSQPLAWFSGWSNGMADFQQWLSSQEAYKITPALFRLQSRCIQTMLDAKCLEDAVNQVLETVGTHFRLSRVYVFLRDEGLIFDNRYEWCARGIEPQMHLFQKVDGALDGFYEALCESEMLIATNAQQLPGNLHERLAAARQPGSVQSMAVMPMKRQGEIVGFVGFDDNNERDWMPEELIMLHNLCLLCLIILAKGENNLKTSMEEKP
ncbi:MAG: EAL domain-containing protein [Oscillospiraceae bacterium]